MTFQLNDNGGGPSGGYRIPLEYVAFARRYFLKKESIVGK